MPYLAHVSLLVRDYDEAITFFSKLGFFVAEDTVIPEQQQRWVTIRPPLPPLPVSTSCSNQDPSGSANPVPSNPNVYQYHGATILLARPSNAEQEVFIGNQTGGRVFLFLATDNFERDFERFTLAGVEWVRPPKNETYGKVAVWKDLYGNLWDLVQYY